MKIVKGNYGECRFCDNMDENQGLPSLEEKSWDLCFTDIPFGVKLNKTTKTFDSYMSISNKAVLYEDNIKWEKQAPNYLDLFLKISKGSIIYTGYKNIGYFISHKNPRQIIYRYAKNSMSNGSLTYRATIFPMVCYGQFNNRLNSDMFEYHSYSGFLQKMKSLKHPCALNPDFVFDLVNQIKPISVIDPFLGSGTTAEVCESLGIPWLGYELMEAYALDIEKRIQRGITKKKYATKQQTLF